MERREGKTQLLLSFKNYIEIVISTVSGWIKTTRHSTRAGSIPKVSLNGLSLSNILDKGSWSNRFTWQKLYNKQITSSEENLQIPHSKVSLVSALNEEGEA